MKKYNPSIIPNQISIDDLPEQNRQQQEAIAAAAATAAASISPVTDTDGRFSFDELNNGGYIILPNRNECLVQTGLPRDIKLPRKNSKAKLVELIPALEIPGDNCSISFAREMSMLRESLNKHETGLSL